MHIKLQQLLAKISFPSTSIHWASLGDSFNMQSPLRDGYRFSTNIKDYEEQHALSPLDGWF
jgi:hypothetical protein